MKDQQFLLEAFNAYYNNGMEAKKKNNIPLAKSNFKKAAEALLKLAKLSTGEVRKSRYERATRLLEYIGNLQKSEVAPIDQATTTNKQTKPSTETVFKAVTVPTIGFDDIAGLDDVKDSVQKRIILPRQYPELYQKYKLKPGGGVLMFGPPGTGKTMIAKAIAKEINAKFFDVKSSDIVSKWVGEAERNIKNLFDTARNEENAVIFFDEFEALGSKRDTDSKSNLLQELLTQIQGFEESKSNIMILAATNRPWDIDSALLRPGRFNEKLYIPLPDDDARRFIINKALDEIPLHQDVNIEEIVSYTNGFNAADVVEFCDRLKLRGIERTLENGGSNYENITKEDVNLTKEKVKSSVSPQDIVALEKWMNSFEVNH